MNLSKKGKHNMSILHIETTKTAMVDGIEWS